MNFKHWQPLLPALALPLLVATGHAQITGVSHPEDTAETAQVGIGTVPAAGGEHYVMPSRAATASPPAQGYAAPPVQPANGGEPVAFAATGPAASPAQPQTPSPKETAQPVSGLLVRQPVASPPAGATGYAATPYARAREEALAPADDDSGIVTEVPATPFELPSGTLLKTRLDTVIGTDTTPIGSAFSAQLLADAGHGGRVLLPSGSVIHGRVTQAHGGRRIAGGAAIRLQPETVTLPDGTSYALYATVTSVESGDNLKVNDEGVINARGNTKAAVGVIGGTTAIAAVTGAVIGGGVGAAVGAGIGAGVGTIVWLKQDHQATLPTGTGLSFALDEPLQLTPR